MIEVRYGVPHSRVDEAVLFSSNDHSIPFSVGQHSELRVEVLDERFRPVPDYAGDACIPVKEAGLRQQVLWMDGDSVQGITGPFRLQITCGGVRPEDVKL